MIATTAAERRRRRPTRTPFVIAHDRRVEHFFEERGDGAERRCPGSAQAPPSTKPIQNDSRAPPYIRRRGAAARRGADEAPVAAVGPQRG